MELKNINFGKKVKLENLLDDNLGRNIRFAIGSKLYFVSGAPRKPENNNLELLIYDSFNKSPIDRFIDSPQKLKDILKKLERE
jgi:hypothetical protein